MVFNIGDVVKYISNVNSTVHTCRLTFNKNYVVVDIENIEGLGTFLSVIDDYGTRSVYSSTVFIQVENALYHQQKYGEHVNEWDMIY